MEHISKRCIYSKFCSERHLFSEQFLFISSGKVFAATDIGEGGSGYDDAPFLSLGRDYTGTAKCGYIKFKTTNNKNVTYQVRGISYHKYGDVFAQLYDADGNFIHTYIWAHGGRPDTRMTLTDLDRNTVYYIRLCKSSCRGDVDFSMKITQLVPDPERTMIESIRAGKKKLTVKWSAVPYASKYVVKYRVRGTSKWKKKTTTKTKMTLRKLKKGKKYQVQVRAIRTVDGKNYNGPFSPTVTKKTK